MQNKKTDVPPKRSYLQTLLAIILTAVLLVSYFIALIKIENPVPAFDEQSKVSSEVSVEESHESSKPEEHFLPKDYDYYNKISFKEEEIRNVEASNGNLALVKGGKSYPDTLNSAIVDESVRDVYDKMTRSAYGLSGIDVEAYDSACEALDAWAVWFASVLPSNCLLVNRGYKDAKQNSLSGRSLDLATGYSFDLSTHGKTYKINDDNYAPFRDQSYVYGFIQRYPEGKKEHTGYDVDYNFYRYVGKAHSDYMHRYKLSLEEYIDKVKTEKIIEFKSRLNTNCAYVVYYVSCDSNSTVTKVPVPSGGENYTISGDGSNGFIVTVEIELN